MRYVTGELSITHDILNPNTGELESRKFTAPRKTSKLRGGFSMVYSDYDTAVGEIIRSQTDYALVTYIRKLFTQKKVEVVISTTDISKKLGISKSKLDLLLKRMLEADLLMRVTRSTYRLNPFMFLPFKADGAELQEEWINLRTEERS